jgi:glycosyltransferase involved in cell wall biosynthesis
MVSCSQNHDTQYPEIIVISSVLPTPTSAGSIILHRHLSQLDNWGVLVVSDPSESNSPNLLTKLLKRLERTRLHRFVNDLTVLAGGHRWEKNLRSHSTNSARTVVLTVAHGDGCCAAKQFAQKNDLPLVTIFHDWWPDMPAVHAPFRQKLGRSFKQLYQASDLALSVSGRMRELLGTHPNSVVLYPIPAVPRENLASGALTTEDHSLSLRVFYSGGLYDYAPMLAELLQVVKDHPTLKLQVRGKNPNWPANFRTEMRDRGLWLDFAPREELDQWLASADAFLVTMSFESTMRRRMETSFSSKLTEFAQFGKPIVIWGPEYCSAIQWGKDGDRALCVTDENPNILVSALEKLNDSPEKQGYYAQQARIAAQGEFNPSTIQNRFLEHIQSLIEKKPKTDSYLFF